jgi:hypothetical protein
VEYDESLSTGTRDRGGASIRLETAGIGEASGVVADLSQQACGGELAEAWEADQDGCIRVLLKDGSRGVGQIVSRLGGSFELLEQGQGLLTHCGFHQRQLMQPGAPKDDLQPNTGGRDTPLPTCAPQGGLQPRARQAGGLGGSRRERQHRACVRMCQTARTLALEGFDERRIVLTEQ